MSVKSKVEVKIAVSSGSISSLIGIKHHCIRFPRVGGEFEFDFIHANIATNVVIGICEGKRYLILAVMLRIKKK